MRRAAVASSVLVLALLAPAASAAGPVRTGILDPGEFGGAQAPIAFDRADSLGASLVRLQLVWRNTVAGGSTTFIDPTDSTDPKYVAAAWQKLDAQVRLAVARGLDPIVYIVKAPDWAEQRQPGDPTDPPLPPGTVRPRAADFAAFVQAAVSRYSGAFCDPSTTCAGGTVCNPAGETCLPRVRYWQIWNEPNLNGYLSPQAGPAPDSPTVYRQLVRAAAPVIRSVPGNLVVAGGLAPFGGVPRDRTAPMTFMRELLCMNRLLKPVQACHATFQAHPVPFDIWSTHPYTNGGPSHHAISADDVSFADLPEMRRLLLAAVRAGHVQSTSAVRFWITEFSWETRPPDTKGVPSNLHRRWVAEALYRLSRWNIGALIWFSIRDDPLPAFVHQSGFWYCGRRTTADDGVCAGDISQDQKKPSYEAFRFPFVAFAGGGRVRVWGMTPTRSSQLVVIQRRTASGWRRVGRLTAGASGVFAKAFRSGATTGYWRARLTFAGSIETSVPFSLTRPKDYPLKHPFGCGGELPC